MTFAQKRKRILGLQLTSQVMDVPVRDLNRLAELRELTSKVRGWTPLNSPARLAIPECGELLERLYGQYRIPQQHLEKALSLSPATLTMWRRSHGYLPRMPSQPFYRGLPSNGGRPPGYGNSWAIGGACPSGHPFLSEADIYRLSELSRCRRCIREKDAAAYQAKKAARTTTK